MTDTERIQHEAMPLASRPLLMGWAVWLLVSWGLNLGIDSPVWMTSEALVPAVRGLMQSAIAGLVPGWPAVRLSQRRPDEPGLRLLVDCVLLLLVFQIVLWPLRILVDWPIGKTLLVDGVFIAWGLAAGLCTYVGWSIGTRAARAAAMVTCAALLGGGIVWVALTNQADAAYWSPVYMLWVLVDPNHRFDAAATAWRLVILAGGAAAAWIVWGGYAGIRGQGTGNREQGNRGTGDREQGTGDRRQGTGDRRQGAGDGGQASDSGV